LHGPIVDIALLVILVLFFGRQQSQRPETYYRLWFAGWLFVLSSYAARMVPVTRPLFLKLQEAIRLDLILAGALLFLVSFVITEKKLWRAVVEGTLVGVPVVLSFDALEFVAVPRWVLMAGVIAWEMYGFRAASLIIPKGRIKTRRAIAAMCVVFGVGMLCYLGFTSGRNIFDLGLSEVVFCSAVLYGGGLQRRTLATYLGMVGFMFWGAFYVCADLLQHWSVKAVAVLWLIWTVPKYFVGSAMVMKTFEDETEEKAKTAEEFRLLYEDFRMMFEEHPHPMWIRDLETDRIISVNRATEETYGYSAEELMTMRESDLMAPETEREEIDGLVPEPLDGMRVQHACKDGRLMWIRLVDRRVMFQGAGARLVMARDVTERVRAGQELARRANYDALTGLANRTLLEDRIQQAFKRCEREGRKATLLTVDVDHFKRINDTYGHPVGDECLQIVAARLATKIRRVDTIARVGGEEFAAIVGGLQRAVDAGKVAESLMRVFDEPMQIGDLDLYVTVSIGIAVYPDDALDAEALKRRSDEALYAAKRGGRNRAIFASEMGAPMEAEVKVGEAERVEAMLIPVRRGYDVTMVTDDGFGS
jgi:diguanylate cyclase (GGDEF)-like protein/PAS domain S-box-containing protein